MEQTLKRLTLHGATGHAVDLGVDLFDGFHGIAFKVVAALVAINNDQFGIVAVFPVRVASLQHTPKRGWDRHPPLRIDLVVAFASEPAAHLLSLPLAPLRLNSLSASIPCPGNGNGGLICCH